MNILLLTLLCSSLPFCQNVHAFSTTRTRTSNTSTTMMQMTTNNNLKNHRYAINLKCKVKPERRNDFLSLIQDNQQKTIQNEPLALQYVIGEDVNSENTFYIHEEFIGQHGFEEHRTMEHAKDWVVFKNSNPFEVGGEPVLDFYYEITDDNVKTKMEQIPIRPAFCVHVELCIKPEIRNDFLQVILNNKRGSDNDEPLCLQYVFGESTKDVNKFIFHEQYSGKDGGKEGFDEHTKTLHFKVWEDFVDKDPFTKPPVVNFFKTLPL